MSTIDQGFRDLVASRGLDEDAADQLRHAARALARMEPWVATSITCTRHVPADQLLVFAGLAYRLAAEYGLAVRVEPTTPACVRFSRKDAGRQDNGHR